MKTKHIFWGLFFITIGILILLNNLSNINLDIPHLWKFWPVVVVIWGLTFLVRNNIVKSLLAGLAAIVLAVTIFAFFNSAFCFVDNKFTINDKGISLEFDGNVDTNNYSIPYDKSIKNAELDFKAGAGTFIIRDTTAQLISAVTTGIKNNYELNRWISDNSTVVNLNMKSRKFTINDGNLKNRAKIRLNTTPVWDYNFELGAASVDFDLSPYKAKDVNIHMGAASLRLKLGNKSDSTNVYVKSGVSSIVILVPDSAGCEIKTEVALSTKDFSGFDKIRSNLYKTGNFDSAPKKIYLNLQAGVSSIKVERYASDW